jgi:hypothetical protein
MQLLLGHIEVAFHGVPRPRVTKSAARGFDDEWNLSDERIAELAALDPEQDWHEVTERNFATLNEYFNFSDAEGWRVYLPASMHHYPSNLESLSDDAVYWACTSKEPKFEMLSPAQLACVRDFLETVHESSDAEPNASVNDGAAPRHGTSLTFGRKMKIPLTGSWQSVRSNIPDYQPGDEWLHFMREGDHVWEIGQPGGKGSRR